MEKELSVDENGENKITDNSNDSEDVDTDPHEPEEGSSLEESKVQNHKELTDITVKSEASESEMILESCNTDLKRVSVPNNILFVKRLDEEDANIAGRSCLLFSAIPLPSGSCIGPFKGEIVSLSSIKQGDLVLQVSYLTFVFTFMKTKNIYRKIQRRILILAFSVGRCQLCFPVVLIVTMRNNEWEMNYQTSSTHVSANFLSLFYNRILVIR